MFSLAAGLYQKYWAPSQLNVLLVGSEGVGKSSLLERIKVTQFAKRPVAENGDGKRRRLRLCPAPAKYAIKLDEEEQEYLMKQQNQNGQDQEHVVNGDEHDSTNTKEPPHPQSSMEDIPIHDETEEAQNGEEEGEPEGDGIMEEYDLKAGAHMLSLSKIRPTIGMNLARVDICSAKCIFWDLGGKMRDLWPKYYADADAVVFVMSTNEPDQVAMLESVRKEVPPEVPVLVFGHYMSSKKKQPLILPNTARDRLVALHVGSAKTGEGVRSAFEWLISLAMKQQRIRQQQTEAAAAMKNEE